VLTFQSILKGNGEFLAVRWQNCPPVQLSVPTIEVMRAIMSAPPGEDLQHLKEIDLWPLRTLELLSRRSEVVSLNTSGALILEAVDGLRSRPPGARIDLPGPGHHERALHARVALARSRVLSNARELQLATDFAFESGYAAHPDETPSPYIAGEPLLLGFWQEGRACRAWETRPLTEEDLLATLKKMEAQAHHGTGLFYELYEQKFTGMVDGWLPKLRDHERAIALRLLKNFCYAPDAKGQWVYDAEENDIHLVGGDQDA
jgi:hypothetical protein